MSQSPPLNLVDLPTEVLVHILKFLHPVWDIPKVSEACRELRAACQNRALKIRHITAKEAQLCHPSVLASAVDPETKELSLCATGTVLPPTLLSKVTAVTRMLTKLTLSNCFLPQDVWMFLPESLEEIHLLQVYFFRYTHLFSNCKNKLTNMRVMTMKVINCPSRVLVNMSKQVFGLRKIFQVDVFKSEEKVFCRRMDMRAASNLECKDFAEAVSSSAWVEVEKGRDRRGRIERVSEEEFKIELRIGALISSHPN